MLKNYFKIALRSLFRNKGLTVLNISGLAIGLACCLLIFVFIKDEMSYDRFHTNAERIYRVTFSTNDDGTPSNANGSFAVGPALTKDFPEVQEFTRLRKTGQIGTKSLVRYEGKSFYEERFFFADSTIFDVFSFSLIKGNPETALARPNTVVITEQTAQKYFPEGDPVGKTLTADPFGNGNLIEFEITGVMENIPKNSHVHFDFLASLYSTNDNLQHFSGFQSVYTYLLLEENSSEEALEAKLINFIYRNWTDDPWYTIQLQPMLDIYLYSQLNSEIQPNGNILYIQIFTVIAIFVLVIACINFMNLITARSIKRAKEVGIRKAAGAERGQLVRQFLTESIVLSIVSGILAVGLIDLLTPLFYNITRKEINFALLISPLVAFGFCGLILTVGILAGAYPAFILSRFKPSNTLKGKLTERASNTYLQKGLVVFQFAISMALIAATGIVYSQLNFIQTKDLGYAGDQIMVIPLNNELRDRYPAFRSELLQHSGILNTTTSSLVPTMGSNHNRFSINGIDQPISFATYFIDEQFVDTNGLRLLAGENARRDMLGDSGGDVLFSELAVEEMEKDAPEEILGRGVEYRGETGRATGVVNDIHVYSFREDIYASAYLITPIQFHRYLSIRLNPSSISEAAGYVQEVWKKMLPGYPLDYFFLDESFEQMHRADMRLAKTITLFALLAILVACLGLFGLSAYAAEQRIKEIGIRKVLGASVSSIITLFSKDFMKLVLMGVAIAVPAAWYFANSWLKDFVYRIDIHASSFLLAGTILVFISLFTISYNSIKAALQNPVKSLKNE